MRAFFFEKRCVFGCEPGQTLKVLGLVYFQTGSGTAQFGSTVV